MLRPGELEIAKTLPPNGCTSSLAQQYTRWLATHHYENFNVGSWLLPKDLHQHFYNLYAYCRWADDLGDEIPARDRALELLDWWESELDTCYDGPPGPLFVRVSRPATPAPFRCDLHSLTACQFLARRLSRFGYRQNLHSARHRCRPLCPRTRYR